MNVLLASGGRGREGVRWGAGFSLVEVTIAIAVVTFSIVGILGMFPAAMRSATESLEETRATHIAQSVFAGLMMPGGPMLVGEEPAQAQSVSLSSEETWMLVYDNESRPLGNPSRGSIASPHGDPRARFLVEVKTKPNSELKTPSNQTYLATNSTLVCVLVTAPAQAPLERRNVYPFATILYNPQTQ